MGLRQRTEVLHSPEPRDCGGFRYGTDDFPQQSCNIKTTMDTSIRVPWCGIALVQTGAQQRTLRASRQSPHLPGGQRVRVQPMSLLGYVPRHGAQGLLFCMRLESADHPWME